MTLPNGKYRTEHGSTMEISGTHGGISKVEFDWFEEPGACCDCIAQPYPDEGRLRWTCADCGGGSAKLYPDDGSV